MNVWDVECVDQGSVELLQNSVDMDMMALLRPDKLLSG